MSIRKSFYALPLEAARSNSHHRL